MTGRRLKHRGQYGHLVRTGAEHSCLAWSDVVGGPVVHSSQMDLHCTAKTRCALLFLQGGRMRTAVFGRLLSGFVVTASGQSVALRGHVRVNPGRVWDVHKTRKAGAQRPSCASLLVRGPDKSPSSEDFQSCFGSSGAGTPAVVLAQTAVSEPTTPIASSKQARPGRGYFRGLNEC